MILSIATALVAFSGAISAQATDSRLVGSWTSKAKTVHTGSEFYDPVNDRLIEPKLPGISYSFTNDGHFEVAYYRAIPDPVNPQCPQGIMQWQHGTYKKYDNGSLVLTPIAVDGRQLLSNPCKYKTAIYTRYNQTELFKRYEVLTDPYHNVLRLNLFKFDGSPLMPLYIDFQTPQMLPTQTLNPTATSSGATKATGSSKFKRALGGGEQEMPLADKWWWIGVGMTGLGGILYVCF